MTTPKIEFIEDGHEYFVDGVKRPSVTTILGPLQDFSAVPAEVLRRAAEFGKHVHKACELFDRGTLDRDQLDPALDDYLQGWEQFLSIYPIEFTHIEEYVASRLGYAGTLDRVGRIGKRYILIDIKSGIKMPSTGPQTAAYQKAFEEMSGIKIHERKSVILREKAFKLIPHDDKNDFNVFLSCLNIYNFKLSNGI